MKKTMVMMVAAMVAAAFTVQAEEAKAPAAPVTPPAPAAAAPKAPAVKKEVPPAQDLELVGKVIQKDVTKKGKDGAEVKSTVIALDIAADGIQVTLPAAKKNAVDPATFVGKDVKVFGKGFSAVDKKGKKTIRLQSVSKIEPVTP